MTTISRTITINAILGTIEEIKHMVERVAPIKPNRFYAWMGRLSVINVGTWTQSSYDAWKKAGRPNRDF
jgi:hypothetical protein